MSDTVIARRYAKALLNLAAADDVIEQVGQGLDEFAELLEQSEELRGFLATPKVGPTEKEQAVTQIVERAQPHNLVGVFLRYLTRKRRILLLGDIRRVYRELADGRLGRAQAEVTVAEELPAEDTERLRSRVAELAGKEISLDVKVNPDILGGVITRIGSTVWDGSVRGQLRQIRQSIIEG